MTLQRKQLERGNKPHQNQNQSPSPPSGVGTTTESHFMLRSNNFVSSQGSPTEGGLWSV